MSKKMIREDPEGLEVYEVSKLRLWVLSDIHSDHTSNFQWLQNRCVRSATTHADVLLCAGDISANEKVFEKTLELLTKRFDLVFFTAGNHDLWKRPATTALGPTTSLDKLQNIERLARELGVKLGPVAFECSKRKKQGLSSRRGHRVIVAPLYSWYEASFDTEPDIAGFAGDDATHRLRWIDYSMCTWGADLEGRPGFRFGPANGASHHIATYFAEKNQTRISNILNYSPPEEKLDPDEDPSDDDEADAVVTMSHFAPRLELMPEKRFLVDPHLPKVCGSAQIETQLRQLQSKCHIFGHTHLAIDEKRDGVRYVNWPLGAFRERPHMTRLVSGTGPLLLYDTDAFAPTQWTFWSYYYRYFPRNPGIHLLAPWVKRAYDALGFSVDDTIQQADREKRKRRPDDVPFPAYPDGQDPDSFYRQNASDQQAWRLAPHTADDFQAPSPAPPPPPGPPDKDDTAVPPASVSEAPPAVPPSSSDNSSITDVPFALPLPSPPAVRGAVLQGQSHIPESQRIE